MKRKKNNGFVLMFVITTLVLMVAMIAVLGNMSRAFVLETNTTYLEACSRNLSASGLAWAKYAIKNKNPTLSDGRIPLDVNDMKMPHATLSLDIHASHAGKEEVTVHTSVSRNNQRQRKETMYLVTITCFDTAAGQNR
jgi:hypothetical protein